MRSSIPCIVDMGVPIELAFFEIRIITAKQDPRFGECYICFGYETKTGEVRILVIFQQGPMFSYINGKLSPRPFE